MMMDARSTPAHTRRSTTRYPAPAALLAALALTLGLAQPAAAQDQELGKQRRGQHAVTPTTSVEEADARLLDVTTKRAAAEATYADSERYCYTKFFVNNCLDKAKEIRRAVLVDLRAIEIEAEHFKRADAVDKRDASLAEQNAQAEADLATRLAQPVKTPSPPQPIKTPTGPLLAQREAEHAAKVQQQQAKDAAEAAPRAAKAAAFERRKAESLQKQKNIAAKQAQKAADAAKSAADKAAADKAAADKAAAAAQKQ